MIQGENIPIRLFLNGYDLTPTMRDVNKKFSVRYYLNLVLIDEEDRRYFKQQVSGKSWGYFKHQEFHECGLMCKARFQNVFRFLCIHKLKMY